MVRRLPLGDWRNAHPAARSFEVREERRFVYARRENGAQDREARLELRPEAKLVVLCAPPPKVVRIAVDALEVDGVTLIQPLGGGGGSAHQTPPPPTAMPPVESGTPPFR